MQLEPTGGTGCCTCAVPASLGSAPRLPVPERTGTLFLSKRCGRGVIYRYQQHEPRAGPSSPGTALINAAAAPGAPPRGRNRSRPAGLRSASHLCGCARPSARMLGRDARPRKTEQKDSRHRQRVALLPRAIPETGPLRSSWRELNRQKRCRFCPFPKVGFVTPPDFPAARLRAPATTSAPQRPPLLSAARPRPPGARQRSPATRRRRAPLRRRSAASQGSWPGAEALCRTAWRRCGGAGSASWGCRGRAVRRELSQVRLCRARRLAGRALALQPQRLPKRCREPLAGRGLRGLTRANAVPRGATGPRRPARAVRAASPRSGSRSRGPCFPEGKGRTRTAGPRLSPGVTRAARLRAEPLRRVPRFGQRGNWVVRAAGALAALPGLLAALLKPSCARY